MVAAPHSPGDRRPGRAAVALAAVLLTAGAVQAQARPPAEPLPPPKVEAAERREPQPFPLLEGAIENPLPGEAGMDGHILPAGCRSCAQGVLGLGTPPPPAFGPSGCATCDGAGCVPGRAGCHPCVSHTWMGRFCCALYDCICCPDPCYEPKWTPIADAAFFVDAPRPVTQMRFRWVSVLNLQAPDRAEYLWARADGGGKGPRPKSPLLGEVRVKYDDLRMYVEGATGAVGVFTETTYRSLDPFSVPHAGGFADLIVGTKTLLFDCELLQVAFQFRTHIPTGNFTKGLGTGHVSLEPSLIVGLKLAPKTFLQAQVAEWIPIGGDPDYQGSILHYHASLNHVLIQFLPDVPLIATMEVNGLSFQDGAYTDPVLGPFRKASNVSYVTAGAGLRLVVCDRIDFGGAAAWAVSHAFAADQEYRMEFRVRY